ncbi:U-box domain-containing protein 26-like isoform X2 [Olea europaea var. sylvestris]|uniref:U-box domain-containing protein n=1 Tax=Olea europaea subsp. europaea TaxID=158383 RepID=A0A8S0V1V6_OLEEU|nr:U-box domain-containing protein 26-like isoform X2 [Olea europaea var. sylvestris]CAA3025556.1 U-box domain-containing 26-like [Olea europaea subsp. europaea]
MEKEGQTYDRSSIEKWLAAGNLTCPVTMQKLHDPSIIPNNTLRHLIDQWLNSGTQIDPVYLHIINSDSSIAAIKHNLESNESTLENKLEILDIICSLADELPLQNSCLIQLDYFCLLLEVVFRKSEGLHFQEDLRFIEKALICALKLLPFSDLGAINMLKEESKFSYFVFIFENGNMAIKKSLCHLVEAIAKGLETKELCNKLGTSVNLLQEIIRLVRDNSEAAEAGVKAISALSLTESNREKLVKEGAVEELVIHISRSKRHERSLAPMAVSVIENLLTVECAKQVIINHPFGVNALVKLVFRVSDHEGSASAVNSLLIICVDSKTAREEAISSGVLTQLLLLLQSQCSGRTKTKARMLLKLLRSKWNEDSNHAL